MKVGDLVKWSNMLPPTRYGLKEVLLGVIIQVEEDFYAESYGLRTPRYHIAWNSGIRSHEPQQAVELVNESR